MLKKLLIMTFSVLLPMSVIADELTLNENAPQTYVVKKGDTLWDISGVFLKQPWLWPKLWRLNPEVNNPHLIYPGDELKLVFDEQGRPMIVRGKPELKWSPKNRITLKEQSAVSTLPLHVVAPYIRYDSVVTEEQLENLPYVIGSDRGKRSSLNGFKTYVNGDLIQGKSYALYIKGDKIVDPESGDTLGYHAALVGSGKAIHTGDVANKEPSTLYLEEVQREVLAGSFVLPVNEGQLYPSYFTMQPLDKSISGTIIESSKGLREFSKLDVVLINRGNEHNVNPGDVVLVKRTSPGIIETSSGPKYASDVSAWHTLGRDSDYKMPEEVVGQMMVFKVYDNVSLALILKANRPLRKMDIVAAP